MRFICKEQDFETLASFLVATCSELGHEVTVDQGRTLAANMLGNTGHTDFLLSLKKSHRDDLDFYLEEGRNANQPIFREYLILGLARIGFRFPEAEHLGFALFDLLDWLPEMQLLPIRSH